jgi:hypothetical protein
MILIMLSFPPLSTLLGVICYHGSVNWWVIHNSNSKVKPIKLTYAKVVRTKVCALVKV